MSEARCGEGCELTDGETEARDGERTLHRKHSSQALSHQSWMEAMTKRRRRHLGAAAGGSGCG